MSSDPTHAFQAGTGGGDTAHHAEPHADTAHAVPAVGTPDAHGAHRNGTHSEPVRTGRTMAERWRHLARHGTAAHLTVLRLALDEAADVVERLSGTVRVLPPAEECTRTETCECVGCVASMHGGDLPPGSVERREPDLAAIRARLAKITPGPWAGQHLTGEKDGSWHIGAGAYRTDDESAEPATVAGFFYDTNGDSIDFDRVICERFSTTGANLADGVFIAHAPADVAALLDLTERLTAERDRLRAERDEARQLHDGAHALLGRAYMERDTAVEALERFAKERAELRRWCGYALSAYPADTPDHEQLVCFEYHSWVSDTLLGARDYTGRRAARAAKPEVPRG
jgi:hypothetical protein